jgi:hypothetical protein
MRGMSLIKDNLRERAETAGSVASSSPPVEPQELSEHRLNVRRSAPSSPDSESSSQQHRIEATKSSGAHPSPIGKATAGPSSKNSSASSPLLTLTPNSSSVDASTDWHSLSGGMPSLPFSQGESSSFGNFNFASSGDNNGLGFGGLRDRAHSSPGPVLSSSPPISVDYRSHFAAHTAYDDAHQERPRSVPRDRPDRPPLSQSYQEGGFVQGDRSNSNGFRRLVDLVVKVVLKLALEPSVDEEWCRQSIALCKMVLTQTVGEPRVETTTTIRILWILSMFRKSLDPCPPSVRTFSSRG